MKLDGQPVENSHSGSMVRNVAIPALCVLAAFAFIVAYWNLVLLVSDAAVHSLSMTALILILGLPALVWILIDPIIGLYLLVVTFPLTNKSIELSFVTVSMPNVLLLTMAAGLTARHFLRPAHRSKAPPLFWSCFGFLTWMIGATVVSSLVTGSTEATARFLVTRIGYLLIFLLIVWLVRDVEKLKRILKLFVLSASVTAIVTIAGGFWPNYFPPELVRCDMEVPLLPLLNTPRCVGLFGNFAAFGTWVVIAIPAALLCVARPRLLGVTKWHAAAMIPTLLLSLAVAQIRGAWVALFGIVLIVLLLGAYRLRQQRRGVLRNTLVSAAILITAAFAVWALVSLLNFTVSLRSETVEERLFLMKVAAQQIVAHPLFGVGPLDERFLLFEEYGLPGLHNTTLVELGATGIMGFIPYIALVSIAFRSCVRVLTKTIIPDLGKLALVILMQFCAVMISLQSYIGIGEKAPWIVMALAVSLTGIDQTMRISPPNIETLA